MLWPVSPTSQKATAPGFRCDFFPCFADLMCRVSCVCVQSDYQWIDQKQTTCRASSYPAVANIKDLQYALPSNETVLLNFLKRQPVAVGLLLDTVNNPFIRWYRYGVYHGEGCPKPRPGPSITYDAWMAVVAARTTDEGEDYYVLVRVSCCAL